MNRIDVAAWTGIWPFTMARETSLEDLVASLRDAGIDGAVVSPLNAVLGPDPMLANDDLLGSVRRVAVDFPLRVCPILNPALLGWEADLQRLRADPLVVGIRLVSVYHGYDVDGPVGVAVVQAIAKVGLPVCVQMRMLDERAHHPLMLVPGVPVAAITRLAATVPEARVLVGGVFRAELAVLAPMANVSIELSFVESSDTLAEAVGAMGSQRVLLGTHTPIHAPEPSVAKVTVIDLDEDSLQAVAAENARALFGFP